MKKAIVVIGGGLRQNGDVWKTIDLGEGGDEHAASNDRWRVDAAFELWKRNSDSLVIASGGKGQLAKIPGAPTVASVIRRELVKLGVPPAAVLEEGESGTTYEQLKALPSFTASQGIGEFLIVSSEWHLPRIEAMLECTPGLSEGFDLVQISLVSAEEVLLKADPERWQKRILQARERPEIKKRFDLEQKGVQDIRSGVYKYG